MIRQRWEEPQGLSPPHVLPTVGYISSSDKPTRATSQLSSLVKGCLNHVCILIWLIFLVCILESEKKD